MFKTVHLNRGFWGKIIPGFKIGKHDPLLVFSDGVNDFSEAMKSFKFKQVYKYTQAGRHTATQAFIKKWMQENNNNPVIVDIGASDGVTSFELIQLLGRNFKSYYVTDYNISCTWLTQNGKTYFFDKEDDCFMVASKKFVYYPEDKWLFDMLFKKTIDAIKGKPKQSLLLITKAVQNEMKADPRIRTQYYNIFEPWQGEKADVIVAANLLNRVYFSDEQIQTALQNCYNALHDKAIIAVIRNQKTGETSETEKANVYQKDESSKSFKSIFEVNSGVEINDFILSVKFK